MVKSEHRREKQYKRYKDKTESPVKQKEFFRLSDEFNKFIIDKVLEGYKVTLPNKSGALHVKGVKPRRCKDGTIHHPINWKSTIALWNKYPEKRKLKITVKWLNFHTDGYTYSFKWEKAGAYVRFKTVYHLFITKGSRKLLKEAITS